MSRSSRIVFSTIFSAALLFCAEASVAFVPEWLPAKDRFEVETGSVAQVETALKLARDGIQPQMRASLEKSKTLGPFLKWSMLWCMPGVTNEASYLKTASAKSVINSTDFDLSSFTNFTSKVRVIPPAVRLSLVFNDGTPGAVARPMPGIDYPGVAYEDEGSTPSKIRIALRVPKMRRRFRVRAQAIQPVARPVEYNWIAPYGWHANKISADENAGTEIGDLRVHRGYLRKPTDRMRICVFARNPKGFWGPPAVVEFRIDELCVHKYNKRELIDSIDYGDYSDSYDCDETGRITGFTRFTKGVYSRQQFSNDGQMILEAHPNGMPRTAKKVRYFVKDGKIQFEVQDEELTYDFGDFKYRPTNL